MKRVWLNLHRWVGLKLSILLSFVLITGTLATVSHEIDWLLDTDRRVLPAYHTEHYNWQGMVDAARQARPNWSLEWISAPIDPWFTAEAVGLTQTGERRRLFINPETLEIQGEGGWFNAQRLFRDSHRRLMIFHRSGIIVVSALSILMIISLISGLYVYKKFWRGFFKKPRTRDRRTLWGDLHRLGGVWSIWFIVVIALTGLWYLVEAIMFLNDIRAVPFPERTFDTQSETHAEVPSVSVPGVSVPGVSVSGVSLNTLADRVRAIEPNFRVTYISLPKFADDHVKLRGQNNAVLTRERSNEFSFDPVTGAVLSQIDGSDLNVHQRISEMADPLHFGTFGGFWTKVLYFIFGVILSAMSLSGIYIYSARMRKAHERGPAKAGVSAVPAQVRAAE